ncbi:MAG: hypothetical protein IGQ45_07825 [Cyanobacterium sp. T60_A2020_053]|nr:hypothetical protein [Cyanobacterium sp. T60_A2020_053]
MRRNTQLISNFLRNVTIISLPLALGLYLLRGFGVISFVSGGVIIFMLGLGALSLILFLIDLTY